MSETSWGVKRDEVMRPVERVARHIASGSGWERWRGGGAAPERNPWQVHGTFDNPAQIGIGLLSYRGPERRGPLRRATTLIRPR